MSEVPPGYIVGLAEPIACVNCGRPTDDGLCVDCLIAGAGENGAGPDDDHAPLLVTARDFIAQVEEEQIPLWGNDACSIIPVGGLALLAGRPGAGKTTLIIDLVCHLAAGLAYPPVDPENNRAPAPWPTPRPLRIALIENEGPREMFRAKLADKLAVFGHGDIAAENILIQTWRWGSFSFADTDAHRRAESELAEHAIDLVIGDPLSTLGPEGVGSPEDTRKFVSWLRPLGLGVDRAFLFLHHFRERVERQQDELARISGAWGGHLDTLITLSAMRKSDQVRLAYPKLRWAKGKPPEPVILGKLFTRASFEALSAENDATALEPYVADHLAELRGMKGGRAGEGWSTSTEIAKALENRRVDIKKALEGAPHLFCQLTGMSAKNLGARSNAVLWGLVEWTKTDAPSDVETELATDGAVTFDLMGQVEDEMRANSGRQPTSEELVSELHRRGYSKPPETDDFPF